MPSRHAIPSQGDLDTYARQPAHYAAQAWVARSVKPYQPSTSRDQGTKTVDTTITVAFDITSVSEQGRDQQAQGSILTVNLLDQAGAVPQPGVDVVGTAAC